MGTWGIIAGAVCVMGAGGLIWQIMARRAKPKRKAVIKPEIELKDASPELLEFIRDNPQKAPFNYLIEDEECGTVQAWVNFDNNYPFVMVPLTVIDRETRQPRKVGEEKVFVSTWDYFNEQVYWLSCKRNHEFLASPPKDKADFLTRFVTPIEPSPELAEILPDGLWRALHRAYDFIPIEFELPPPEWLQGFMKYALISLAIGAFIFVIAQGK